MDCYSLENSFPSKQGLRLHGNTLNDSPSSFRDHFPLKQGLRLKPVPAWQPSRSASQRPSSIKTRVKAPVCIRRLVLAVNKGYILLQQGLRPLLTSLNSTKAKRQSHLPLKQGLRPKHLVDNLVEAQLVRVHLPLKQGLRQPKNSIMVSPVLPVRADFPLKQGLRHVIIGAGFIHIAVVRDHLPP